ncbi:MAG: helix-hairpin-helix domain-containing protein [Halanaerobiales bacterium]
MNKDQLILLLFATIIIIMGAGIFFWQNMKNSQLISSMTVSASLNQTDLFSGHHGSNPLSEESVKEIKNEKILVHVAGEVLNSGVYELESGARVIDALMAAGGATSLANLDIINLAAPISDGEKIYIPSVIEKINQFNQNSSFTSYSSGGSSGKININTADASELQKLTGIGPGKAKSIIDYRNKNGPFKSVDDLLNVSGIGEKTLEKIRDEIVVR